MTSFQNTTQYRHWTYDAQDKVERLRLAAYGKSREAIEAAEGGLDREMVQRKNVLEIEECLELMSAALLSMERVCRSFKFPRVVFATAAHLMQRLYLVRSVLDHDPQDVMPCILYLSTKIEEAYTGAASLAKHLDVPVKSITQRELEILEAVRFHLHIIHPYNAMRACLTAFNLDKATKKKAEPECIRWIDTCLFSDAIFIATPGQIALFAVSKVLGQGACDSIAQQFKEESAVDLHVKLKQIEHEHNRAQTRLEKLKDTEYCSTLRSRWKLCHNPVFDPTSDTRRRKREEAEAEEEKRWQEKHKKSSEERRKRQAALLG